MTIYHTSILNLSLFPFHNKICEFIFILSLKITIHLQLYGDVPVGPVAKTSPSNAVSVGSIPGPELRSHMPLSQKTKT